MKSYEYCNILLIIDIKCSLSIIIHKNRQVLAIKLLLTLNILEKKTLFKRNLVIIIIQSIGFVPSYKIK